MSAFNAAADCAAALNQGARILMQGFAVVLLSRNETRIKMRAAGSQQPFRPADLGDRRIQALCPFLAAELAHHVVREGWMAALR